MATVLVVYATKYGSTEELAGAVAAALRERGVDTELTRADAVSSLDGYSAVVIGSALYNHKWHKDAASFVERQRAALGRLPVAVFTIGPVNDTPEEFDAARGQLDSLLARWDWLSPVSVAVFGGRFDPARFHFPGASLLLRKAPASDIVDPEAASSWARSLPEALSLG